MHDIQRRVLIAWLLILTAVVPNGWKLKANLVGKQVVKHFFSFFFFL